MLDDILQKLISRAGNESRQPSLSEHCSYCARVHMDFILQVSAPGRLFPLNYDRLLRTDEGNALPLQAGCMRDGASLCAGLLQVFPDVDARFHAAVVGVGRGPSSQRCNQRCNLER